MATDIVPQKLQQVHMSGKLKADEPGGTMLGAVLILGHAVKHVFNSAFFIILPEIQLALGMSNVAIGTLAAIRNTGGGIASLPAGYLSDRFVDSWPMILAICMVAVGVFYFLMGSVSTYALLVFTATLSAVAISTWHPSAISALAQKFPGRRGFAIALHGTGGSVGEALGPILVGALLGLIVWRLVFQLSMIPAFGMATLVWFGLRGLRGRSPNFTSFKTYLASFHYLVFHPPLFKVLIITGGFSAAQAVVITFLPIYLRVELGYSPLAMAAFISTSHVIGILSQPVMGYLSDRYSRKALLIPSLIGLGMAVLAIPIAGSGINLVVVVACIGIFLFSLMAVLLAAAIDVTGHDMQGTTVSLVFSASILFGAATPIVAGMLADTFGMGYAFSFASAVAFATALFTAFARISNEELND
jgi:MFS family permease